MNHARTILALALGLAACSDLNVPSGKDINYAVFNFPGTPSGGQVQVRPEGIFFRAQQGGIGGTDTPGDRCSDVAILPTPSPSVRNVAGGDSAVVTIGAGASTLALKPSGTTTQTYVLPAGGTFTMAAGSWLKVETVGADAGFPAAIDSVISAEPFTMTAIPDTIDLQQEGLPITWTPAPTSHSKLVVSLKYGSSGATAPDREVVCTLDDDGSYVIPSTTALGYARSARTTRGNSASRIRAKLKLVGDNLLVIASSYDITVPSAPPASAAVAP